MSRNKILPVFIPFAGCRNRCIYCNQYRIAEQQPQSLILSAKEQIQKYIAYAESFDELAFYGGSFTCLPEKDRLSLYQLAADYGFSVIRFSTSPDCISESVLDEAYAHGVRTIELGIQTLSENILHLNKRPYSAETCLNAVRMVQKRFVTGVQLMTGMFGETRDDVKKTADTFAALKPEYARIYPTVVLADTELALLFESGTYSPPPPAEILLRTAYVYCCLHSQGTTIIRTGLQYTDTIYESIKGGYYRPAFGDMVKTLITLIYLENIGNIYVNKDSIQKYYGFKALARKHFSDKIIADKTFQTDFKEICLKSKEYILENHRRNIKRDATSYAEELIREADNR